MRFFVLVALAALAIDQGSKHLVLTGLDLRRTTPIDILPPYLRFVMAWNQGVNFGVLASGSAAARWALTALALVISAGVTIWALRAAARGRADHWFLAGAALVVGGAIGNAIDRVRFGAVADFLNMSCCGIVNPYVFNVADIAIFLGAALLILRSGERTGASAGASE